MWCGPALVRQETGPAGSKGRVVVWVVSDNFKIKKKKKKKNEKQMKSNRNEELSNLFSWRKFKH